MISRRELFSRTGLAAGWLALPPALKLFEHVPLTEDLAAVRAFDHNNDLIALGQMPFEWIGGEPIALSDEWDFLNAKTLMHLRRISMSLVLRSNETVEGDIRMAPGGYFLMPSDMVRLGFHEGKILWNLIP